MAWGRYARCPVSTRRLIITALVCGMAILLAGGVFLVRIANNRVEITTNRIGDVVRVGDLRVTVVRVTEGADALRVGVEIDATDATLAASVDAEERWTLVIGGARDRLEPTGGTPCRGARIESGRTLTCDLAFAPADGPTYLSFELGEGGARWRLD